MAGLQFQNQYQAQAHEQSTVILKSRDSELLEVDEDVAYESMTIQAMCSHLGPKKESPMRVFVVPLTTKLLASVIDYCKFQVEAREYANRNPSESVKEKWKSWEEQYEKLDFSSICDLLLAANYMDVPPMEKMLSTLATRKMPRGSKTMPVDARRDESPSYTSRTFLYG